MFLDEVEKGERMLLVPKLIGGIHVPGVEMI